MKIKSAELLCSAPDLTACPREMWPEFALIGRSNVGKSSLINMLAQRQALARVSVTPGKTQLLNFFKINDAWLLVDLPGYGYAKVSKDQRADFNEAVHDYLRERGALKCVFVLIDVTIPAQAIDLEFLRWLAEEEVPFVLVFTKADRISGAKAESNMAAFMRNIAGWWGGELPGAILCSSKEKSGRGEILAVVQGAMK